MSTSVAVIGAGMGGLTAAIRLARQGLCVQVFEARSRAGGLAAGFTSDGMQFDAGPYVLLDRPGLEWAFNSLDLDLDSHLDLRRIPQVYEVQCDNEPPVRICDSLDETIDGLEQRWPGSGRHYRRFVESTQQTYARLQPLQWISHPRPIDVLRTGAWRDVPFLFRSLGSVLNRTQLPATVVNALGIWTHVAGQQIAKAPSPLAFVPSVIHGAGAWVPRDGIGTIAHTLASIAVNAGVEFHFDTKVRAIRCQHGRVTGIETDQEQFIPADAILANSSSIGTYLNLLTNGDESGSSNPVAPSRVRSRLNQLPLQSPGVCAYLAVKRATPPPYLRFQLPSNNELCRLLVTPSVMSPELEHDGWWPARLIAPMDHNTAETGGPDVQREYLHRILDEPWWRAHVGEFKVLQTRIPAEWGSQFQLHRNSMNPVMTARFMRTGRIAHRSPYVRGLYLAGSATHPGQWVSFCAISGILAADRLREDYS